MFTRCKMLQIRLISNVGLYGVSIFWFRAMDKMDSVMKGLMGQCPSPRIFGLEPPLVPVLYCGVCVNAGCIRLIWHVSTSMVRRLMLMRRTRRDGRTARYHSRQIDSGTGRCNYRQMVERLDIIIVQSVLKHLQTDQWKTVTDVVNCDGNKYLCSRCNGAR